jgi:hypothetical protein
MRRERVSFPLLKIGELEAPGSNEHDAKARSATMVYVINHFRINVFIGMFYLTKKSLQFISKYEFPIYN